MVLKGTHGTCASFAEDIRNSGFSFGPGRRGKGVYFWGYSGANKEYATALAKAWWAQAKAIRKYDAASDQDCNVLHVDIKPEEGCLLDLEELVMKQTLLQFLNDIHKRSLPKDRASLTEKAYDLFVHMLEKQLNKKFDVIYTTVNPPKTDFWDKRDRFPGFDIIGMAPCYVVKNTGCIFLMQ